MNEPKESADGTHVSPEGEAHTPAVVDDVLPDTLYLMPIPQRPFFPGQVQPVDGQTSCLLCPASRPLSSSTGMLCLARCPPMTVRGVALGLWNDVSPTPAPTAAPTPPPPSAKAAAAARTSSGGWGDGSVGGGGGGSEAPAGAQRVGASLSGHEGGYARAHAEELARAQLELERCQY